jgi:hypothetical protein
MLNNYWMPVIVMSLLGLFGCGPSTVEMPASSAGIIAEIDIEHSTERTTDSLHDFDWAAAKVVLRNSKGKAIEQADMQVLLNGTPLDFRVATGNYYDRYPVYNASREQLAELAPNAICHFELITPDGKRSEIAEVKLGGDISIDSFDVPRLHHAGTPMPVRWHDLNVPAQLVVFRGLNYPDEFGNEVWIAGTKDEEGAIRKKIGPGFLRKSSGELVVPAIFFDEHPPDVLSNGKRQRVAAVTVEVFATVQGKINPAFHSGSYVRAQRDIKIYLEVAPLQKP